MSDHVFELSDPGKVQNLMTRGGGPAVIDFWAAWCAPCRAMKPVFEGVAASFSDSEVGFYSLDTEAHKDLARGFRIRSLPTLVLVDDGDVVDVVVGRIDGKRLTKKVEWLIRRSRGEGLISRIASRLRGS